MQAIKPSSCCPRLSVPTSNSAVRCNILNVRVGKAKMERLTQVSPLPRWIGITAINSYSVEILVYLSECDSGTVPCNADMLASGRSINKSTSNRLGFPAVSIGENDKVREPGAEV